MMQRPPSDTFPKFLVWFLYPAVPRYSVCGEDMIWSSIVVNMNLRLSWEQDVYFSVYNPNRFAMNISHVKVLFTFEEEQIGESDPLRIEVPPGSIQDAVMTVRFHPRDFTQMWLRYRKSNLTIGVDYFVVAHMGIFNFNRSDSSVLNTWTPSVKYCKCV